MIYPRSIAIALSLYLCSGAMEESHNVRRLDECQSSVDHISKLFQTVHVVGHNNTIGVLSSSTTSKDSFIVITGSDNEVTLRPGTEISRKLYDITPHLKYAQAVVDHYTGHKPMNHSEIAEHHKGHEEHLKEHAQKLEDHVEHLKKQNLTEHNGHYWHSGWASYINHWIPYVSGKVVVSSNGVYNNPYGKKVEFDGSRGPPVATIVGNQNLVPLPVTKATITGSNNILGAVPQCNANEAVECEVRFSLRNSYVHIFNNLVLKTCKSKGCTGNVRDQLLANKELMNHLALKGSCHVVGNCVFDVNFCGEQLEAIRVGAANTDSKGNVQTAATAQALSATSGASAGEMSFALLLVSSIIGMIYG